MAHEHDHVRAPAVAYSLQAWDRLTTSHRETSAEDCDSFLPPPRPAAPPVAFFSLVSDDGMAECDGFFVTSFRLLAPSRAAPARPLLARV